MEKIKVAIVGYGNIGHYTLQALEAAPDFELVGIVRRHPEEKQPKELASYKVVKDIQELGQVDVAILATPSRKVEETAKPILVLGINTVDSFDIHTEVLALRSKLSAAALAHNAVSIISAGWDPGTDSIVRTMLQAIAPKGVTYTNFGPGMSMGHTVAVKAIKGVKAALSMTIPLGTSIHRRMVYIELEEGADFKEVEAAINDNTKLVLIETLGNPLINIPELEKLAEIAHKYQIPLVSDNTFATPYLINVFSHGVDIAIHSATKFIGGHGTTIGGVIVDSGRFDWAASGKFPQFVEEDPSYHNLSYTRDVGAAAFIIAVRVQLLRDTGAALSPFNAFLLLQGLETLSLRVERHVQNAEKIVDFLVNHPKVEKVNYPKLADSPYHALAEKYLPKGVGSIFTFHVKGGEAEARKVIDHLEIFSDLANVADAKSLVVHPATTTHGQLSEKDLEAAGVTPNQIRLSIGLENVEDLIEDLRLALEKI